jgi:hypothetical protein
MHSLPWECDSESTLSGKGPPCPIDRGNFEDYDRVETEYMQYEEPRAADGNLHSTAGS